MVAAIDKKLFRDLSTLRGQILTICLVVASGIAAYIAMQTAYRSLHLSKQHYYEAYRFPDVFAQARRVPNTVKKRLADLPGVAVVHTRTMEAVRVPLEGRDKAITGRIVSLPDRGEPPLNALFIREGRMPDLAHEEEALILEIFATKNDIKLGDQLPLIINGTKRHITVTGIAMSPEFVFAIGGDVLSYEPGSFAVIWMRESSVAPVFDMQGAFNDVLVRLQPGASAAAVIDGVDRILAPYGGFGAYDRDRHVSHHFVSSELQGLEIQATLIPLIFLAVAAFLVNVVLGRLVQLQRGQIATLKALGYSNTSVGLHFLKLVSIIVLGGSVLGIAGGAWMGSSLIEVYKEYFQFPVFEHELDPPVVLVALSISLFTAIAGGFLSVHSIMALPPPQAMRPPAPPMYRTTVLDSESQLVLGALGRMVARDLWRQPLRVGVSIAGISLAVAILVIGRFAIDSIEALLAMQFGQAMREDITVLLRDPVPTRVTQSMLQLPGVLHAEGVRSVPVRIRSGSAFRNTSIQAFADDSRLRTLINRNGDEVDLPLGGMLLTDVLAERLGAKAGDVAEITLLVGDRRKEEVLIAGTVSDMLGMQAYMRKEALEEVLGDRSLVSMLLLSVEASQRTEVERRLYEMPAVVSVSRPSAAQESFEKQQGGSMLVMNIVLAFFASVIAIGIVYNNARVSLSMRRRDLASMRVLGFTRTEISSVLLGELAVQVLVALPIGMVLGTMGANALLATDPENFRLPVVISGQTYAYAAITTLGAALVSGLLVRRKLDRLDLISVLKTRE